MYDIQIDKIQINTNKIIRINNRISVSKTTFNPPPPGGSQDPHSLSRQEGAKNVRRMIATHTWLQSVNNTCFVTKCDLWLNLVLNLILTLVLQQCRKTLVMPCIKTGES